MSYFASKRPGTPEKSVRKNNKTESCKAVWDYGFHSTYTTTHSSDYTNKGEEMIDRQKPRQEPRDHLWFLCFDDSPKFLEREKYIAITDFRAILDDKPLRQVPVENHYQSQMKANFTVPGFPRKADTSLPAGKTTESNHTGLQYSSQKLVDILESVPSTDFHGHRVDIFLPPFEQSKRFGVQTWMDYPEKNLEMINDFPAGDVALMRKKKPTQLTVPIAGK